MPTLLLAVLAAATMVTANAAAFAVRVQALEGRWGAAEAAGVPALRLAEARRELAAERARRVGPLPYPLVSGAALWDPFQRPEASGEAAVEAARSASRDRALAALARLRQAGGPGYDLQYEDRLIQLYRAQRPADLDRLAGRWAAEAGALERARQELSAAAGGLSQGLPADIVAGTAQLAGLAGQAGRAGVSSAEAGAAIAHAQLYLARPYPELLAGHGEIRAELQAAMAVLQRRLDLRARADQLLVEVPGLLDQATRYGAGDDLKTRAGQVRASLDAARAAGEDGRLDAALADLQKLDDDLHAAAGGWLPTGGTPCLPDAPGQLIVIHLATQQLIAYDGGCPILLTPVTTGRPALPTGRGTFHLFYKSPSYHMISPWPAGSPFYYPPTWVYDAMEFIGDGTFIHNADWQPDATYGPGSEYGGYASHGCVHVIDGPLKQLYEWARIGATVVVED